MHRTIGLEKAALFFGIILVAAGCSKASSEKAEKAEKPAPETPAADAKDVSASDEVSPRMLRRFQPIKDRLETPDNALTPEKIELGRRLFNETAISKDKDLSCNSCHDLAKHGVDGETTSIGQGGQRGGRNSPTVFNAAGFFAQFWDGRMQSVEQQAKGPVLNPKEMAMPDAAAVEARLRAAPGYAAAFKAAFPEDAEPLTFDNTARAIAAFERTLMTPGRWDKYLAGDTKALTHAEKEGLKTFLNVGCMVCHTGPYLGGTMFERAGVVEPWPNQKDAGRFEVTKLEGDRMMFKVPTLRNIEYTAPYFHDSSAKTLEDAVRLMGKHQVGVELTSKEVDSIVVWLKSLSGDVPKSAATPKAVADRAAPGGSRR